MLKARHVGGVERVEQFNEFRTPALAEIDGVELVHEDRKVGEGDAVDPNRDDEAWVRQRFPHRVGHGELVSYPLALGIDALSRGNEDDLAGVLPKRVLDRAPERRSALQAEHVRPYFVAVARKSRAEPTDKIVVVRRGVADENGVPRHVAAESVQPSLVRSGPRTAS